MENIQNLRSILSQSTHVTDETWILSIAYTVSANTNPTQDACFVTEDNIFIAGDGKVTWDLYTNPTNGATPQSTFTQSLGVVIYEALTGTKYVGTITQTNNMSVKTYKLITQMLDANNKMTATDVSKKIASIIGVPDDISQKKSYTKIILTIIMAVIAVIIAAAIAFAIFNNLTNKTNNAQSQPQSKAAQSYITHKTPIMPDVTGKTEEEAKKILTKFNIPIKSQPIVSTEFTPGTVVLTYPIPGAEIEEGLTDHIVLTIAAEPNTKDTVIPNLIGLNYDDAEKILKSANIKIEKVDYDSENPAGTIFQQTPGGGNKGDSVIVFVSTGMMPVPLVNPGDDVNETIGKLESYGFSVELQDTPTNDPNMSNKVVSTTPLTGSVLKPKSKVIINVGKYDKPAQQPTQQSERQPRQQHPTQRSPQQEPTPTQQTQQSDNGERE